MNWTSAGLTGFLCLTGVLLAGAARADVARPDNHCPTLGAACNNAGFLADDPGICKDAPDLQCGAGGGTSVLSCAICELSDAGMSGVAGDTAETAGAPNAAGAANHAGSSNAAAGNTSGSYGNDTEDSGCSVHTIGSERGIATLLLGLGLTALTLSRRRR